jgi:hypothetical protein
MQNDSRSKRFGHELERNEGEFDLESKKFVSRPQNPNPRSGNADGEQDLPFGITPAGPGGPLAQDLRRHYHEEGLEAVPALRRRQVRSALREPVELGVEVHLPRGEQAKYFLVELLVAAAATLWSTRAVRISVTAALNHAFGALKLPGANMSTGL